MRSFEWSFEGSGWALVFFLIALPVVGFVSGGVYGYEKGAIAVAEGTLLCDKLPNGERWIREAGDRGLGK